MHVKRKSEKYTALLYVIPAAIIIFAFRLIPMVYALVISFFDWGIGGPKKFLFLGNYIELLQNPNFYTSLINTIYFVIGTVPVGLFLALFIAVLLNQKIQGRGIYRTIYFLPVITSLVAVSVVWKWIFNPRTGVANYVLSLIGMPKLLWLEEPKGVHQMLFDLIGVQLPSFLQGPSLAMVAIILTSIWKGLGYNVVIFLAGLQNISKELYEAARIDGANSWQTFRNVTWPLLSPTTFYVLIMTTIISFQVFTQIYVMTGPPVGGPMGTTKVIVYYLFEEGFDNFQIGYANAVAFVLFLIILALTIFQKQVIEKRVHY